MSHVTAPRPTAPAGIDPRRRMGIALAGVTAAVSGVSVFVNGYGMGHFDDPTTYTTAKNLVAALAIGAILTVRHGIASGRGTEPAASPTSPPAATTRIGLLAVALIGGSIPFVLFFEGFARVSSNDAAFIHKTLVVWVAVLAGVFLRERISAVHVVAMALILAGYASVAGGVGVPAVGSGEVLILLATLCWSVEVVIARSLLRNGVPEMTVAAWRMVGGVVVLVVWAIVRGAFADLFALSVAQWGWILLTGAFLTAYVVSWHHALARAPAVDVTAMLASGAVVTALLNIGIRSIAIDPLGVTLLLAGGVLVAVAALLTPARATPTRAVPT